MQPFRTLYFKEQFVAIALARVFYESRFTTCEGLISPDQLTLIGVSISNYSYDWSSRMNDTARE